jgi:hypothetical protein
VMNRARAKGPRLFSIYRESECEFS